MFMSIRGGRGIHRSSGRVRERLMEGGQRIAGIDRRWCGIALALL